MDKIDIHRKPFKNIKFDFEEIEVEVKPFISLTEQVALTEAYLKTMFMDEENRFLIILKRDRLRAEYQQMIMLLNILTNINVESIDAVDVYLEDLFQEVTARIENYESFRYKLSLVVEDFAKEIELESSVGKVIENLSNKILEAISTFSELTPEKIDDMTDKANKLLLEAKGISNPDTLLEKPKRKRARRNVKK